MKNRSRRKSRKCNNETSFNTSAASKRSVKSWNRGTVSIVKKKRYCKYKKSNFIFYKIVENNTFKNARFTKSNFPNFGSFARAVSSRRNDTTALPAKKKVNNSQNQKTSLMIDPEGPRDPGNHRIDRYDKNHRNYSKNKLLRSGDVELNPGPVRISDYNEMEIITYNCRGLKDYRKLKRVLNSCAGVIKAKHLSLILLQETHLIKEEENKLRVMWRGGYVASPGQGASRGCLTLFDSRWKVEENFVSADGRMTCSALSMGQTEVIIVNVYVPNDHDLNFIEMVFERIIEFRDKYPSYEIILAGDFNLVMDKDKDSINRTDTPGEQISRKLFADNLRVLELRDAFREKNNSGGYTWSRGKTFSRLDYVFISNGWASKVCGGKVDWTFDKSDHAAVKVELRIQRESPKGPGLIRVNAEILKIEHIKSEFCSRVNEAMTGTPVGWNPNQRLEFLKVITRSILGELNGREKKIEEIESVAMNEQLNRLKINKAECTRRGLEIPGIDESINELQESLDNNLKRKSEILAEKARCRWFCEGEKSNKYFLNLLKRKKKETLITELSNGPKTASNQKDIETLVTDFYAKLYDVDKTLKADYDSFFPELPTIDDDERRALDSPITLEELRETLATCGESAPGPDGIPYLVYKMCWEVYGKFLLESWLYSKHKGILPDFNRVSAIMLIPKEGKDPKQIGNWRPITLTNCDLKIFTKLLADRVSKVLPKIIMRSQVAYIPGRVVHDNLRMFEFYKNYCSQNNIDAVLISLDAAKAFDSVDHNYMFEALKRYGFSNEFVNLVKMLYNEIRAEILVNGFSTTMIKIRRCVKQGDALSCALFIICLDPVLRKIENNKKIEQIEIVTPLSNEKVNSKTGGYADDVGAAVLNKKETIDNIFKEYGEFSAYSGIRLNEEKSEIMSLSRVYERKVFEIDNGNKKFTITSVNRIKICGITFSQDSQLAHEVNVTQKIDKMERNLIAWLHRGLSLPGKILVVNTFGLSQLIYTMQMCEYRADDLKRIETMIFKFLWSKSWLGNRTPERIKREILKGEIAEGGLKVPDAVTLNEALKTKQFFRALKGDHPITTIQRYITEKLDYDFVYQQEYSRITNMEEVAGVAQKAVNKITDHMREVIDAEGASKYQADLISSTDVVEYLSRKNHGLALCYFKRLFSLGIESYIQLKREFNYPRSDTTKKISEFVLKSFPVKWLEIVQLHEVDEHIELSNNIPIRKDKGSEVKNITVKMLRKVLRGGKGVSSQFPYNIKLGIVNHSGINPFVINKRVNRSVNLFHFKYRLLQGDIYTKERMLKFKMVHTNLCDHCGRVENEIHMLWECARAKKVWEAIQRLLDVLEPGLIMEFQSIFIGFSPTKPVIESLITATTRQIISRDRSGDIIMNFLKISLLEHCSLNRTLMLKEKKPGEEWERAKTIINTIMI